MSIRDLQRLEIPDGTTVEEHDLVTAGDVFVGGQSTVEFGVRGRTVVGGERVRFGGDIEAEGDCRLDMWCDVGGNVLVGEDAYLGERVHVGGQLIVSGDLDIGDDVDVEEGFEANGWIVIRNPMPTIVFLFVYLTQLLRLGEDEEAERVLSEVAAGDAGPDPVLVPRGSRVSDDAWQVSTPAVVGADCRLHGNLRAESIEVGDRTELFGSLRAKGDVSVGRDAVIHGDVTTRSGAVSIGAGATVRGDVSCDDLTLHDSAEVDGTLRANGEVTIRHEQPDRPDLAAVEADDEATPVEDLPPAVTAIDGDAWLAAHSRLAREDNTVEVEAVDSVDAADPAVVEADDR
ncbi:MAG: polymer-forming cytoskeletal protein [Haloarculaceae archaeon]